MKKIIFLFFIISGFLIPFFVFAADTPDQKAAADCLSQAYSNYINKVNDCNAKVQADIQAKIDVINKDLDTQTALCYQQSDPTICAEQVANYTNRIQKLQQDATQQQVDCRDGQLKQEYTAAQNKCYENTSFNNVWDLPVLKQMLKNQALDTTNFSQEQIDKLSACVQKLADDNQLDANSPDSYTKMGECYKEAGILQNTTELFTGASVVLNCASEKLDLQPGQSLLNLAATASGQQRQYLEQCVVKKLNPVVAGVAVLNVPFAGGFGNFFLYFQFLFTQPLLLITKKKNKSWGKIFNSLNQKPVDLATVRLLTKDNNKVAKTIVTGRSGEYLFLPAPGTYELDVQKTGFVFPSNYVDTEMSNEYNGEDIVVDSHDDVVNKYVPVDPAEKKPSRLLFNLRKWKKRIAILLGFTAPLFAAIVVFLMPHWWTVALLIVHLILLFLFIRLSFAKKEPQYGRVYGPKKSVLIGVTVSLFDKKFNRLIDYYVTDIFGRYFLPIAIGEYSVVFEKKGFERKQIDLSISSKEKDAKILKIDVALDKKKD